MRPALLTIVCILLFLSGGAQKPQLIFPTGHTGKIYSISFNDDETMMVSASEDHSARVWDVGSGKLLARLLDDSSSIIDAYLTRNGKKVITRSKEKIRIWDIETRTCLYKFYENLGITDEAFLVDQQDSIRIVSFQGKLSISRLSGDFSLVPIDETVNTTNNNYQDRLRKQSIRGFDGVYHVMDTLTGKAIRNLPDSTMMVDMARSPDNRRFVFYNRFSENVKVFDMYDNRYHELTDFSYDSPASYDKRKMNTSFVSFSENGKLLVVSKSYDGMWADLFYQEKAIIQVWDMEKYTLLTELPAHQYAVDVVAFNKTNTKLLSAGSDNLVKLWDLTNPILKNPLQVFKGHSSFSNFEFNPVNNEVLVRMDNKSARLWDIAAGKCIPFESQNIGALHYSSDGKYFWVLSADDLKVTVYFSDTKAVIRSETFSHPVLSVKTLGHFFFISTQFSVYKLDISQKNLVKKKLASSGADDPYTSVAVSPGYLITASPGKGVLIKNLKTGTIKKIPSPDSTKRDVSLSLNDSSSRLLVVFADGFGYTHPDVVLYDILGRKLHKIETDMPGVHGTLSVKFSHKGKYISSTGEDGEVYLWDAEKGERIFNRKMNGGSYKEQDVYTPVFSKDDRTLVCSSSDGKLWGWDTQTGERVLALQTENAESYIATDLSADNKFLIAATAEGKITLWDLANRKPLYSLVPLDEKDHLFIDKDANYDGSAGARKLLYLVCGTEIIDLDQFKEIGWQPGLAAKIIGFDKEPLQENNLSKLSVCNVSPLVKSQGLQNGAYQFQITERDGGLGVVQVFINGKLVKTHATDVLTKLGNSTYQFSLKQEDVSRYFLTGTDNQNLIQVKVTTRDNTMTSRGGEGEGPVLTEKKVNPNIYIVAIGVNDYKGPQLHLQYAASDAVGFASALTPAAKKLLNTDSAEHVNTYVFTTNKENADKPYKKSIKERLEKIAAEAKANDILLVFFAGHGVLFGDKKTFYLLTAEASAFDLSGVEKEVAISYQELSEWMRNIAAHKQVLIMDACNSGAVVPGARGIPADLARAQENLKDQTGTNLLAASASGMSAYEATEFGQGYLTYGLLSAIKNQDGLTENKFIDIATWFGAAVKKVTELSVETGKRQDPKINVEASFALGMVDTSLLNRIKLPKRKEVFARSVMVSLPGMTDPLRLALKQDSVLNNLSAMGKESPLTFIETNTSMEAYSIRGNYEIQNNKLIIKVSLIYGEKPVYQFVKSGSVDQASVLSMAVTEDIIAHLKKKNKN